LLGCSLVVWGGVGWFEETKELREYSGLGGGGEPAPPVGESPLPDDAPQGEPLARTSSRDADSVREDG